MNFGDLKTKWRDQLKQAGKYPLQSRIYDRGFKESHLLALLPDFHYLLQEELRSLETASVMTRGMIQSLLSKVYKYAYEQRKQIQSIELDLELGDQHWSLKARPETLSYSSYSYYLLHHLSPLSYLAPYFHLHYFLLEAISKMKNPSLRFARDVVRQKQAFEEMFEQVFDQLDPESVKMLIEGLGASVQIFEYILLLLKEERLIDRKVTKGTKLSEHTMNFNLFHERRSTLLQT